MLKKSAKKTKCAEMLEPVKKHHKVCKRFHAEGFCVYGRDCTYLHTKSEHKTKTKEDEELKEKVKYLEEALAALTVTVSNLQGQVCDMSEKSWDDSNDTLYSNSEEDNEVEDNT